MKKINESASSGEGESPLSATFSNIADRVSFGMGTWQNILVWIVLVFGWTALFGLHIVSPSGSFLPSWFTSTGYNFPLNLVTTVAELYIGFLVAAAANRTERANKAQADRIEQLEATVLDQVRVDQTLTKAVHDLTVEIHAHIVPPQNP